MARLLASDDGAAGIDLLNMAVEGGGSDGADAAVAHDAHDADLLLATAQDELVAEQHEAVHAFHAHMKHGGEVHSGRGGAGIIWLLILLHLAFIGYLGWIWWRQRKQREVAGRKPSGPQKVNCVYDWSATPLPLPAIQLAKAAQH